MMQAARVLPNRAQRRHQAPIETLPDGSFILQGHDAWLVWQSHLLRSGPGSYTAKIPRPARGSVTVLTPVPTVAALARDYRPTLNPKAQHLLG